MKVNKEGRKLVDFVEEVGWNIFNVNIRGDEEGKYTYIGGRGNTVIDYVIGKEEVRNKMLKLEVGDRIDSNHPIEVWIEGGVEGKNVRKEKGNNRSGRKV